MHQLVILKRDGCRQETTPLRTGSAPIKEAHKLIRSFNIHIELEFARGLLSEFSMAQANRRWVSSGCVKYYLLPLTSPTYRCCCKRRTSWCYPLQIFTIWRLTSHNPSSMDTSYSELRDLCNFTWVKNKTYLEGKSRYTSITELRYTEVTIAFS